ncbi:hypothetical protein GCM10023192_44500 [Amycolatopsis samaneae]
MAVPQMTFGDPGAAGVREWIKTTDGQSRTVAATAPLATSPTSKPPTPEWPAAGQPRTSHLPAAPSARAPPRPAPPAPTYTPALSAFSPLNALSGAPPSAFSGLNAALSNAKE